MDTLTALLQNGSITQAVFERAKEKVADGAAVETALIEAELAPPDVRTLMAAYYEVPAYEPPKEIRIKESLLELVPEESARHYQIVPYEIEDGVLLVAVTHPEDVQIREVLNFVSARHHQPYKMTYVLPADMERLLQAYATLTGEIGEALTSLESELDAEIAARQNEVQGAGSVSEHFEEDAPVTKIVATVLRYAVDGGASDIHIEPFQGRVRVRFRVDGHLQTSLQLPKNVHSAVVARVKILSTMRLDERRKPQDGRFSATFDGRKVDFRVSVLPTNAGEKVVMRILDSERGVHTLSETGISAHNLEMVKQAVHEPYGIILISGPTGSGKSTTLYSMLEAVDRETKNVLSLEDPVEYNIEGVAQSQVRPEIGYTFAAGLRSALRQDPDIILVGEIRDAETAQLAIQAALTGHLVLSTIHTNNAIGVIPRLIDMGVDPYLIAPTLKIVIAQRLARRICPGSGKPVSITGGVEDMVTKAFADLPERYRDRIPVTSQMFKLEPSDECPSGTRGRVAVSECLAITEEIEAQILNNASEEEIYTSARANGFMTLAEDAIIKAMEGIIPFEDVGTFVSQVGNSGLDLEETESTPVTAVPAATAATAPTVQPVSASADGRPVDNSPNSEQSAV